ncbi:hypothetical protein AB3X96_38475 [Paraburkholderia sp. BR13439]|uniref:hypothetical protein n=1 Tax=Paraburkholderia TaxID=1822464 RepID=UPI0034CD1746
MQLAYAFFYCGRRNHIRLDERQPARPTLYYFRQMGLRAPAFVPVPFDMKNVRQAEMRIQHPRRHDPHYAWAGLNVHHATAASLFDVSYLDATPIQGMSTVMDFNFLPDMGRMIANLLSA